MKKDDVKQFVWFESFTQAVEKLPGAAAKGYMAYILYQYGALGIEPKFNFDEIAGTPAYVFESLFEALRPNIDNSIKNFNNGKKGAEYGKKGGRPRKNETPEQARARREQEKDLIEQPADLNVDLSGLDLDEIAERDAAFMSMNM